MAAPRNANVVSEEELQLRKRARRRLVGAIALVLIAVVVLPLVLDHEPRQPPRNVRVEMQQPAVDHNAAAPAASAPAVPLPPAEIAPPASATSAAQSPTGGAAGSAQSPIAEAPPPDTTAAVSPSVSPASQTAAPRDASATAASAPAPKKIEPKPFAVAPKPAQTAGEFVIQLGAFADVSRARALEQRIKKAGFPVYLERMPQAGRTRVRAGPYASREAAQKAYESIKRRKLTIGSSEGQIVPKGL